jgi:hypothetical protein
MGQILAWLRGNARFQKDNAGFVNLGKAMSVLAVVIAAVLTLSFLGATIGDLMSSGKTVTENITAGSVGNDSADALLPTFGFLAAIALVIGIVGLALNAVKFKGGK